MVIAAVATVLAPGAPLVAILYLTQALNAILLLPVLVLILGIARDPDLMGSHVSGLAGTAAAAATIGLVSLAVGALAMISLIA